MDRLHLQQNELAEKTGVSPATVNNWLGGVNWPKQRNLRDLFRALELETEQLQAWLLGAEIAYPPHHPRPGELALLDLLPADEARRQGHDHLEARFDECRDLKEMGAVLTVLQVSLPLHAVTRRRGEGKKTEDGGLKTEDGGDHAKTLRRQGEKKTEDGGPKTKDGMEPKLAQAIQAVENVKPAQPPIK